MSSISTLLGSGRHSIALSPCISSVSGESASLGRLTSSFIPRDELLELANKVTLCG